MGSITLETARRDRSLKRSCATLVPKMVNSSSSCRLPPKSEHHSLRCILHWECEISATKLDTIRSGSPIERKNVRQHRLFGFGIHRYVPRYRDGRHKPQGILVRARRDHADVPDRSHRSCETQRGTPEPLGAGITPQREHGVDLNSSDGSICLALRPGEVFRHFSGSRRGICRATPSCTRRRNSPAGRCQRSSDRQGG